MRIEVFYFEGCPSHAPVMQTIQQILGEENLQAEVREIGVPDEKAAREIGFRGSPTIRVEGLDIETKTHATSDFGLCCRMYPSDEGVRALPPADMIREAVLHAAENEARG
jgi:hypothetical protein